VLKSLSNGTPADSNGDGTAGNYATNGMQQNPVFLTEDSTEVRRFWRAVSRMCETEKECLVRWWTGLEV